MMIMIMMMMIIMIMIMISTMIIFMMMIMMTCRAGPRWPRRWAVVPCTASPCTRRGATCV